MQLRITHNVISTIYRIPWGICDNGDGDGDDDDDDGNDGDDDAVVADAGDDDDDEDDNVCVDNEGTPKAVANLMSRFACRPTSNNLYTAHYKQSPNLQHPIHCPLQHIHCPLLLAL